MGSDKTAEEYEKWLRVITLLHHAGNIACKYVFHDKGKIPDNGNRLYEHLLLNERDLKRKCRQEQLELIYPKNKITDTSKWDITLFTCVIHIIFGHDKYYKDFIDELRDYRNSFFHKGTVQMSQDEFNEDWDKISKFFVRYGVEQSDIDTMKTCNLDLNQNYSNAYSEAKAFEKEMKKRNIIQKGMHQIHFP